MLTNGKMRLVGSTQWRVTLAVVFFLVTSLQGALFASAGSVATVAANSAAHQEMVADVAADDHHAAHAAHAGDAATPAPGHHGDKSLSDTGCEVHCAPASAVPVNSAEIVHAVARCFAQAIPPILVDGTYAEFIRPPRSLI